MCYRESLAIGVKIVDAYNRFYGEVNYMRFEQLAVVLKCYAALGKKEQVEKAKENIAKIGVPLLGEDSYQLKALLEL